MREQTVANHHHLCEATREEIGGRRETKEKKNQHQERITRCWLSRVLSKIKDRKA
jgi:hypothetical protein